MKTVSAGWSACSSHGHGEIGASKLDHASSHLFSASGRNDGSSDSTKMRGFYVATVSNYATAEPLPGFSIRP